MKVYLVLSESKLPHHRRGNLEYEKIVEVFSTREEAEWYVCNINNDAEIIEYKVDSFDKNKDNTYLIYAYKYFDKPVNIDYQLFFQSSLYEDFVEDNSFVILKVKEEIDKEKIKLSLLVRAKTIKEAVDIAMPLFKEVFDANNNIQL